MVKVVASETNFIVRYAETDQMGIVHHSNYPVWFEAGRTDLIKSIGLSYSQMEQQGVWLPLLELKCSFKGFSKYEDQIVVKSRIKELTNARVTFFYEVFKNNEEKPITQGETMHAFTTEHLKPVNMMKYNPNILERIKKLI